MATTKKKKASKAKVQPELNIDPALFEAWQKFTRMGDALAIANRFGWSRPTIDNALNFGHVRNNEIVGQITTYFTERVKDEREKAELINTAAEN